VTPVDQLTEHDCLRACVASLLSIPVEEVPDFGIEAGQWDRLNAWLGERGLYAVCLDAQAFKPWVPSGYHMMGGKPAGGDADRHMVVGWRGEMVHDPHPTRYGLSTVDVWNLIVVADLALIKPGGAA